MYAADLEANEKVDVQGALEVPKAVDIKSLPSDLDGERRAMLAKERLERTAVLLNNNVRQVEVAQ